MKLISFKEQRVLEALYKLGDSPISNIAEETLINRTALYPTVKKLIKKGLVTKITKENGAHFQAISLEEYKLWSKRQLNLLSQQTKEIEDKLREQKNEQPSLYSDIKYFEGMEGVKSLYSDTWRDNQEKTIYAITDYEKAYETLGDFFTKDYFPERIKRGVKVKSLLPPSFSGKRDKKQEKELLREMRFSNIFKDLGIEINVYGSKVSIVTFDEKHPSGILLKNDIIANAFKDIFKYIWKQADQK